MLHLTHRPKPFFGGTSNGLHYHGCQSVREIWFKSQDRRGILSNMLIHDSKGTLSLEWRAPTEHFVKNDPHGIDVRTSHTTFTLQLFRRHIIGSAHCTSQTTPCDPASPFQQSNTKIDNFDVAIILDHNILRLDIAVKYAMFMTVG